MGRLTMPAQKPNLNVQLKNMQFEIEKLRKRIACSKYTDGLEEYFKMSFLAVKVRLDRQNVTYERSAPFPDDLY
jgi:hypothetical protein